MGLRYAFHLEGYHGDLVHAVVLEQRRKQQQAGGHWEVCGSGLEQWFELRGRTSLVKQKGLVMAFHFTKDVGLLKH
eukprot:1139263-Pelagomonas_calceolata.AAC.2